MSYPQAGEYRMITNKHKILRSMHLKTMMSHDSSSTE